MLLLVRYHAGKPVTTEGARTGAGAVVTRCTTMKLWLGCQRVFRKDAVSKYINLVFDRISVDYLSQGPRGADPCPPAASDRCASRTAAIDRAIRFRKSPDESHPAWQ
jgi:hypothetical protein